MHRDHLFYFLAKRSNHPSRLQIPPPNISAHCLHKVQMKSLITHLPIGSCLRIIERGAAAALTFFLPPRHHPLTGMPVCWYGWAFGCVYMCCAAAGTCLMKRSRRIVVVGGWMGGVGAMGLSSLAFSWEVLCVRGGDEPKPQGQGSWLMGVGSGWSRLSRVTEISPGRALEQRPSSSGAAKSRSKYWM